MVFTSAIRRLYKEGILKKVQLLDGINSYELTNKGCQQAKKVLDSAQISDCTKVIDGIRLKIIRSQYY